MATDPRQRRRAKARANRRLFEWRYVRALREIGEAMQRAFKARVLQRLNVHIQQTARLGDGPER